MGFLGLRNRYPSCLTQVQIDLFTVVESRDDQRLTQLINRYDEVIRLEFPRWRTCWKELQPCQRWSGFYVEGLIGIADFYRRYGVSALIDLLQGDDETNPLRRWQKLLESIEAAFKDARFALVISLATQALADMDGESGTGVDTMKLLFLGHLGAAHFQMGDKANALAFTRQGLEGCRDQGDAVGERTYRKNLARIEALP